MTWKIKNPEALVLAKLNGKSPVPIVGETYTIEDVRKGTFTGMITYVDGEWAAVLLEKGIAKFINAPDHGPYDTVIIQASDTVIIQASLCKLTKTSIT